MTVRQLDQRNCTIELVSDDLREIDNATSKIKVQGDWKRAISLLLKGEETMQKRKLGKSNIAVSAIGSAGCMGMSHGYSRSPRSSGFRCVSQALARSLPFA